MRPLPDHGLPLVQLKEQRRDLVVALQNRNGPISGWELMQIAAVQQAISAFEEVIADLDAEAEMEAAACRSRRRAVSIRIVNSVASAPRVRGRPDPGHR
jgi:hypothetical protein